MLKWLKIDQGFESQTFQLNSDPLKHFSLPNTLISHLDTYKSIPRNQEIQNFGLNFRGGGSQPLRQVILEVSGDFF